MYADEGPAGPLDAFAGDEVEQLDRGGEEVDFGCPLRKVADAESAPELGVAREAPGEVADAAKPDPWADELGGEVEAVRALEVCLELVEVLVDQAPEPDKFGRPPSRP